MPRTVTNRSPASKRAASPCSSEPRPTNSSRSAGSECGVSRAGRQEACQAITRYDVAESGGGEKGCSPGTPISKSSIGSTMPFNR